ncbi:hypothetical protein Kfla_7061 [Kribbella flavida DSM 17836]|uniref:Uncharacterized protein n=1 Tax=Kribbella flavida (strain DSM 17836 / JCM 10339 / NBRC 14399) TaxID=479435 RepID=D2Q538_KRIFD|nr:hypothetical protein Kfla_7061 [Kribbella flavida DSM 17836]
MTGPSVEAESPTRDPLAFADRSTSPMTTLRTSREGASPR